MTKTTTKVSTQVVLKSLEKKAGPLIKQLEHQNKTGIKDNTEFDFAANKLKLVKEMGKEAKTQLDSILDPAKQIIANAKSIFAPFFETLERIEAETKEEMKKFKADQDRKAMKVLKDFEDGKIKKVGTVVAKQAELTVSSGSAKLRKIAKAKCIDAKLTPREYLVPDERAILDALKSGKKVKGWEIELVDSIAI